MEKIKLSYIIYFIAGITFLLISVSAYKAERNHEDKLYHVLHSKIKEAALECYLKKECTERITLQDLYQKEYLSELFDPVTKEKIDNKMCIEYVNEEVKFCS